MSYFTETFESILETKEANKTPAHDHPGSNNFKTAQDKKDHDNANRPNHSASQRLKDRIENQKNALDKKTDKNGMHAYTADNDLNNAKVRAHSNRQHGDVPYTGAGLHAQAKLNHRSLKEGFDPVYEDLCRMGIID